MQKLVLKSDGKGAISYMADPDDVQPLITGAYISRHTLAVMQGANSMSEMTVPQEISIEVTLD